MKKILSVISAVALMFAGCTNDLTNDLNAPTAGAEVEAGPLVEKTAVIVDSRVGRDGEGKLSWSEGDQIAVVLQGADGKLAFDSKTYTIDATTGKVAVPSNAVYVIYPHNLNSKAITSGSSVMTFRLAHITAPETTEDIFNFCPMKGVVGDELIEFNNLMAFAKFTLKGTGKLKSAVLRTISNTSSDFHPISNSASIDLSCNVTEDGGLIMKTNNESFAWMRQNFQGDIDLSTNPSVYVPVPEGEYENMGLVVVTDKGSHTIYANNKHAFTRSTVKSVSQAPIDLDAHTPQSPVSLAGTTGKACEDYASCYLVPPTAGSYKFPCILADGTSLKGGVTAEIKWAEEAGMVNDIYYDAVTNEISFKTNGKKGNVLVTLTTNNYDAHTVVWNWHLWITDTPKVLQVATTDTKEGATPYYYLMDRVVGATWSPSAPIEQTSTMTISNKTIAMNNNLSLENANDACGLYYQYQRVTPIPRIKDLHYIGGEKIATLANTRCGVMYGFSQYNQYWASSTNGGDIWADKNGNGQYVHNSIVYPNYEYNLNNSWILANVINEFSTANPDGSVLISEGKYRLWRSVSSNNHDTMMKGKTPHDPCPPGYVIENYSQLYWSVVTRAAEFGYTRAKEDNTTYKSGFKFYGMYYNGSVDKDGNSVPMYWPCGSNKRDVTTSVSGAYNNCGYLYAVNTNNTSTYDVQNSDKSQTFTIGKGGALAYGEVANSYTEPGIAAGSASKTVNSQGYHVRCRRGKW